MNCVIENVVIRRIIMMCRIRMKRNGQHVFNLSTETNSTQPLYDIVIEKAGCPVSVYGLQWCERIHVMRVSSYGTLQGTRISLSSQSLSGSVFISTGGFSFTHRWVWSTFFSCCFGVVLFCWSILCRPRAFTLAATHNPRSEFYPNNHSKTR